MKRRQTIIHRKTGSKFNQSRVICMSLRAILNTDLLLQAFMWEYLLKQAIEDVPN